MEKALPKNWIRVTLNQISVKVENVNPVDVFVSDFNYIDISSVNSERFDIETPKKIDKNGAPSRARQLVKEGDIIVSTVRPNLQRIAQVKTELNNQIASTGFCVVRLNENIESRFLFYQLICDSFTNSLIGLQRGASYPAVRNSDVLDQSVLLTSSSEQQRIVAKLDALFGHLEQVKTRLANIPQLLKNFRQAILTQAVTGKLTEEWREGKELGEWEDSTIGELFTVKTGATPKRGTNEYYNNATIPWLKSGQVKNELIYHAEEFITELAVKESNAKIYPKETLLVAMYGEGKTRGQVGWMKIEAASNQAIAALVNTEMLTQTRQYVFYYCLSQYAEIRKQAEGGNQPNLNLSKIKKWEIHLPSFEEQTEIVRRVESLFAKADAIEAKYKTLKVQIDNLPQALLAKAFKGELVEQLDTDGDARDLLKEIKKLKG